MNGYQQSQSLQPPMRNYPNSSNLVPRNSISSILNASSTQESINRNAKNTQFEMVSSQQQKNFTESPLPTNSQYKTQSLDKPVVSLAAILTTFQQQQQQQNQQQQQPQQSYYLYSPKKQTQLQKARANSIALLINHDSLQQHILKTKPSPSTSPMMSSSSASLSNNNKVGNNSHSQSPLIQRNQENVSTGMLLEKKDTLSKPRVDLNSLVIDLDSLVNDGLLKFNATTVGNSASSVSNNVSNPVSRDSSPRYQNAGNQAQQSNLTATRYNFKISSSALQSCPIKMSEIDIDEPQRKYIDYFYNDFCKVILPFEPATGVNPIRDMLLREATLHDYLLLAILASGAKSCYEHTGSSQDSDACDQFLTSCYQSSVRAFGDSKFVDANVESVLFTVLLLTTYNATSRNQSWRTHLNGAKDLLKKYAFSESKKTITAGLTVSLYWFIVFEMLVGLLNPYGGTLSTDDELDMFFLCDGENLSIMKDLSLVSMDEDYNLMYCFHNDFVTTLKNIIKLLNRVKIVTKDFYSIDSTTDSSWFEKVNISVDEIFDLLAQLSKERKYEVISADGKVPMFHKMHFHNYDYGAEIAGISEKNRLAISENMKGIVFFMNPKKISRLTNLEIYSWYDISHQSFVIGCMLVLLTTFLRTRKETSVVQELVHKLIHEMYFFFDFLVENDTGYVIDLQVVRNSGIKYYFMLIQWPMLVAGFNCIDEPSRLKIESFFKLLSKVGVGSAGHSLNKLNFCWRNNQTANLTLKDDKSSSISDGSHQNASENSRNNEGNKIFFSESEEDIVPY